MEQYWVSSRFVRNGPNSPLEPKSPFIIVSGNRTRRKEIRKKDNQRGNKNKKKREWV